MSCSTILLYIFNCASNMNTRKGNLHSCTQSELHEYSNTKMTSSGMCKRSQAQKWKQVPQNVKLHLQSGCWSIMLSWFTTQDLWWCMYGKLRKLSFFPCMLYWWPAGWEGSEVMDAICSAIMAYLCSLNQTHEGCRGPCIHSPWYYAQTSVYHVWVTIACCLNATRNTSALLYG